MVKKRVKTQLDSSLTIVIDFQIVGSFCAIRAAVDEVETGEVAFGRAAKAHLD